MKVTALVICTALTAIPAAQADELYDFVCCPRDNCESVASNSVSQVADGYLVHSLQEVVATGDPRIRISRDGRYHLCTRSRATPEMSGAQVAALAGQRQVKCLYVPAMF